MPLRPLSLALAISLAVGLPALAHAQSTPAAPATSTASEAVQPADAAADALFAEYWEASLKLSPLRATFVGDARYNDQLPDLFSDQSRAESSAFNKAWLARVEALDLEALSAQRRLSAEILLRDLKLEIEGERFPGWQQPLDQFRNVAALFAQLGSGTNAQPFKTVQDYDNWLKRASRLPVLFTTMQANMREGMASGVVQPRVLMQKVIPQLDALIKDKPEDTLFWRPIANLPADLPAAEKERLTAAYRTLIAEQLMPAYRELRRFVADEYLPKTRDTVAISALPDGEAWYAYLAKVQTTTDLTPAQIHDIGLAEVARIQGEMHDVMKQMGFEGSLQDFFVHMTTAKEYEYPTEEALLADYNSLRERIDVRAKELFSLVPKAGFEIRPVEAFRAASAAGGSYQGPSQDGTRPGVFYVNTYDLPSRKNWDRDALYLHEAVPGHHFQIALQQELTDLPMFRRFGGETAFAEGWGLYAESLGKELGAYDTPQQYFGRLQAEIWRAIRLVVDTGLHSKAWTREQVIAYMKANSATTDTEAVSEAERYIAIPGQALAYKIGELKILELRARAEEALGDRFDIKAFHAEVLEDGSLPLSVLEAKLDRFIAARKG
ncbi:DUF885 family protein [Silanimonas sp.]|uniref:DUF885 domain-containing protein n=1 Tax=Silanimonas sp. TaxID=1929290 RepID=UPI0022BB196E|nr:DUF885 family protein [Silanimonas sp.]MCZ8114815.1 DUF885 family protein [Silanimonas sp.]